MPLRSELKEIRQTIKDNPETILAIWHRGFSGISLAAGTCALDDKENTVFHVKIHYTGKIKTIAFSDVVYVEIAGF